MNTISERIRLPKTKFSWRMIVMELEKLVKIVGVLAENIIEGTNINQVARKSGISAASTYRILKEMEKDNLIKKQKSGNNVFYRLNLKNTFARKYAELASIRKREAFFRKKPEHYELLMGLKESIKEFSCVIGIFGSLARMEEKPRDMDILIVYKQLKPIRAVFSKRTEKFSPFYITESEFREKIRESIIASIIKDVIILHGECEFWSILSEAV